LPALDSLRTYKNIANKIVSGEQLSEKEAAVYAKHLEGIDRLVNKLRSKINKNSANDSSPTDQPTSDVSPANQPVAEASSPEKTKQPDGASSLHVETRSETVSKSLKNPIPPIPPIE
jgi:hypothetical protein